MILNWAQAYSKVSHHYVGNLHAMAHPQQQRTAELTHTTNMYVHSSALLVWT